MTAFLKIENCKIDNSFCFLLSTVSFYSGHNKYDDSNYLDFAKIFGLNYIDMLSVIVEEASKRKMTLKSLDKMKSGKISICIAPEMGVNDIEQLKQFIKKIELSKFIYSLSVN